MTMKFNRIIFATLAAAVLICCKKKDDDTITPSLNGNLSITGLKEFVAPGETLSLSAKGVTHPTGGTLSYTWTVNPTAPTAQTGVNYEITFTDTLQTCTVTCSVSADGYSGKSLSSFVTVVKGGKDGSIKGLTFPEEKVTTEDGIYYIATIGTQTWTANNMAEKSSGIAYRNEDVMSDVLGRYYSYEEAKTVCEALGENWALPSDEDWDTLSEYIKSQTSTTGYGQTVAAALMGDATFNGTTMWEFWPYDSQEQTGVGDITNASLFGAIPSGFANMATKTFTGVYEYAAFWTSTEVDGENAKYRYLICDEGDLFTATGDKNSFGASVRCIRK